MFLDNYIFIIALSLILKALHILTKRRGRITQHKDGKVDSVFKIEMLFELTIKRNGVS